MAKVVNLDTLPEVRLLEDITRESAARLIDELAQYKGQRVALSIFSNGGDVHGSQAVAAYIGNKANEMQVEARIYGNAASGAMIIAAACQKAYIAAGAFALIHKAAAVGPDGVRIPKEELPKEEVAVLEAMNADQIALFQKRTGKTAASIEKLMDQDRDMPAEEATELGFFDGIIPQALRLAAYKSIPMAEDKKTIAFKATAGDIAKAVISGTFEVPVEQVAAQATAAEAAKVAELQTAIDAKAKELEDLKAEKVALETAKTTAEASAKEAVDAKAVVDTELVATKAEVAKYVAVIEALKKTPLVAQTLPDGTQVVIPDGAADPKQEQKSKRDLELEASANAWEEAKKQYILK